MNSDLMKMISQSPLCIHFFLFLDKFIGPVSLFFLPFWNKPQTHLAICLSAFHSVPHNSFRENQN